MTIHGVKDNACRLHAFHQGNQLQVDDYIANYCFCVCSVKAGGLQPRFSATGRTVSVSARGSGTFAAIGRGCKPPRRRGMATPRLGAISECRASAALRRDLVCCGRARLFIGCRLERPAD
jgi:hypothetical protein